MADPHGESSGLASSELNGDSGKFHEVSSMPTRYLQLTPYPMKNVRYRHMGLKQKVMGM